MRRLGRWGLSMLLCLWLPLTGIAEALLPIVTEDLAALIMRDGAEVIAPGVWEDILELIPGERYALGRRDADRMRYRLGDASGTVLGNADYDMLAGAGEHILYRDGTMYGILDSDGSVLLGSVCTDIVPAGDGGYLILKGDTTDETPDRLIRLDTDMTMRITEVTVSFGLERVSEGRMPYVDGSTGFSGYVAADGSIALEPAYDWCEGFSGGLAIACMGGGSGVLRMDGSWLIEPVHGRTGRFADGFYTIDRVDDGSEVLRMWDAAGVCVKELSGSELSVREAGALLHVVTADGAALYNAEGICVAETEVDRTILAGAGGVTVCRTGSFGEACEAVLYADGTVSERNEQRIVPLDAACCAFYVFRTARYESTDLGEVRLSSDYASMQAGLMTVDGDTLLEAEYRTVRMVGEGRYLAEREDCALVVDGAGQVIWRWSAS